MSDVSIPAMAKRLEMWPLDRLRPYANNARVHSERQVEQIAASIREFGFTAPILVDSADGILAGHGRLQAAHLLGLATVPVVVLDHLDEVQRRAYLLADNRLAEGATWDQELLAKELAAIDLDPRRLGFDEDELQRLHDGLELLVLEEMGGGGPATRTSVWSPRPGNPGRPRRSLRTMARPLRMRAARWKSGTCSA
jgi:ParB-like chromosome segregation protein Spo0J